MIQYSAKRFCIILCTIYRPDQTYTTSEKGLCGVRALEVPELQTIEVEVEN